MPPQGYEIHSIAAPVCTLSSWLDEETLSMECLSYSEAFAILIGCYFISESIVEKGPSVSVKQVLCLTASFIQVNKSPKVFQMVP